MAYTNMLPTAATPNTISKSWVVGYTGPEHHAQTLLELLQIPLLIGQLSLPQTIDLLLVVVVVVQAGHRPLFPY